MGPGASPRIARKLNGCGPWTQALDLCLLKKKKKIVLIWCVRSQVPRCPEMMVGGFCWIWRGFLALGCAAFHRWLLAAGYLDFSHSIKLSILPAQSNWTSSPSVTLSSRKTQPPASASCSVGSVPRSEFPHQQMCRSFLGSPPYSL